MRFLGVEGVPLQSPGPHLDPHSLAQVHHITQCLLALSLTILRTELKVVGHLRVLRVGGGGIRTGFTGSKWEGHTTQQQ